VSAPRNAAAPAAPNAASAAFSHSGSTKKAIETPSDAAIEAIAKSLVR